MVIRVEDVKQWNKSRNKWKKEINDIKKQNKILYNIAKKAGSLRETKNTKEIKAKAPKKGRNDSNDSYSDESYSDYSLSSDSDWDEERQPARNREKNRLKHIVNNNIKKDKDQHNEAIENEPKFDSSFNLSSGTKDPLPVVTVSLRGDKKHIATTVASITF